MKNIENIFLNTKKYLLKETQNAMLIKAPKIPWFNEQIVMLYKNGKSVINLGKEYNLPKPTIYSWVKNYNNSGSFKAKDNRTVEENELLSLRKELIQLRMENDILKQAALIMAKK